ncbi:hypothetical protein AB0D10_43825 [Kitasatospora sp. NPDC048545]|uniref:hypothetical protein n=1 Tax=Kitasatospora sp. NPDC048545 TaxID=3157208 RepID=UPI0033C23D6B
MNARIEDAKPPGRRPRVTGRVVARALARILLVVAGLSTVVAGFGWFLDTFHAVDAYRSAPQCGTAAAAPGAPCVLRETGRVTARSTSTSDDSIFYNLSVARETAPTGSFSVGEAFYDDASVGTTVDLTIWNGRVVEVSWHGHRAPTRDIPALAALKLAGLIGAASAVLVHGLAWPRLGAAAVAPAAGFVIAVSAFLGSVMLFAAQWPMIITLGVPVLGWLFVVVIGTSIAHEI